MDGTQTISPIGATGGCSQIKNTCHLCLRLLACFHATITPEVNHTFCGLIVDCWWNASKDNSYFVCGSGVCLSVETVGNFLV